MSNIYLVSISTTSYSVVAIYKTDAEAVAGILAAFHKYRTCSWVLRHGATGKRECVAEVEARTKKAA